MLRSADKSGNCPRGHVSDERIDHRSYAAQGIDKIPTVHLGAGACAIEKKGKKTDRGLLNLQIEIENTSNALTSMRQEMENNRKFISEQKEQHCQEYFGCSLSETCHVIEKDDYISYLAEEMRKRNENTLLAKVDDDRTRMTIAKRNTEMLDEIMDEMHTASVYVHNHNLYPTGWRVAATAKPITICIRFISKVVKPDLCTSELTNR